MLIDRGQQRHVVGGSHNEDDDKPTIRKYPNHDSGSSEARQKPEGKLKVPRAVDLIHRLSAILFNRFTSLGQLEDLNNTIRCYQLMNFLASQSQTPINWAFLWVLADCRLRRFEALGEITDLKKAVNNLSHVLLNIPDGLADRSLFTKLGTSFKRLFEHLGHLSDLDKAIKYQYQAVLHTPDGHAIKPFHLNSLGELFTLRFERLGELTDIANAIHYHRQAVSLIPEGDSNKPGLLGNLGNGYQSRYKHFFGLSDIENAIKYQTQAVLLAPDGDSNKPLLLQMLGVSYMRRFERLGELADIDKAIGYETQAVSLMPDGHPNKPSMLDTLGRSYLKRFERFGQLPDEDKGITCGKRAALLSPDSHSDKPDLLYTLGNTYMRRFDRLGNLPDLIEAIGCHSKGVQLTLNGHASRRPLLSSLGSAYQLRFRHLGQLADIDKAVSCQSEALRLTLDDLVDVPGDQLDKPSLLNNLGRSYQFRFESFGNLADIEKAIEHHAEGVLLISDGHPEKHRRVVNLGNSYMCRYEHLRQLADVNKGVECYRRALLLVPDGHSDELILLGNLGNSYLRLFQHRDLLEDLDKAIDYHSRALLLSPDSHVGRPLYLGNLGTSYRCRFVRLGQLADINKAIDYQIESVSLVSNNRADKPLWLSNLAYSYQYRFECSKERSDCEAAITFFQQAAQFAVGSPRIRFNAARQWARISYAIGVSMQVAYQRTMALVPELVWLGATIDHRYNLVTEIGDVAMEAAAYAISLGAYDHALEWLEEGRSVVWNQILQLRAAFDDLAAANPTLANRLEDVGRQLELASSRSGTLTGSNQAALSEEEAQCHRRLATQWGQLLEQARQLPGFDAFMCPRKAATLMHAAKSGPLVVINIHWSRCDALILQPNNSNIAHVPLVNFSLEKAADADSLLMSSIAHRGGRSGGFKRNKPMPESSEVFRKMLSGLWSGIVKPVLDFLGANCQSINYPLSFLPLHAAGCYDGSQPNAFDLVISSYTPTLSALLSTSPQALNSHSGIVAVGQEHTAGLGHLPNTVSELAAIKEYAKTCLLLDGEKATVDRVLASMDKFSWVHFACHAQQSGDPMKSAFHLHDGSLTLSMITKRSFKNKGLAFLSACQTATGDSKLPEEAAHLAAGMLMAGYPSVIATLWAIYDDDAGRVSKQVYADLLKGDQMDCRGAAKALHMAVSALREKVGEASFERWVPFIHMGV